MIWDYRNARRGGYRRRTAVTIAVQNETVRLFAVLAARVSRFA